MGNYIYASITEETIVGARDRVLDDLNALTDGQAEKAIAYVSEYVELDKVLRDHKEYLKTKETEESTC